MRQNLLLVLLAMVLLASCGVPAEESLETSLPPSPVVDLPAPPVPKIPPTGTPDDPIFFRDDFNTHTGNSDCIFYRAGEGTWQVRTSDLQATHIGPMRPPCPDGVVIANGLFYWGPWMCQRPLSLYGHVALAPAGKFNYRPGADNSRWEPGEGDPTAVQPLPIARGDWPCYQGDNQRSGVTPVALPEHVTRQWQFQPPAPARPTAPVTAGNLVFVGDERVVLRAVDALNGKV